MIDAVAPYLLTRAFVGGMIDAGWGRIVNITSAASLHPPGPLNSAYGTAKVALNQFTRHLAAELAGTGVTANVLHPGDVKTDMWADIRDRALAAGPAAEAYQQWVRWVDETGGDPPHKAVDAVLRLCDDEAADISGPVLLDRRPAAGADPELGHRRRRPAVDDGGLTQSRIWARIVPNGYSGRGVGRFRPRERRRPALVSRTQRDLTTSTVARQ